VTQLHRTDPPLVRAIGSTEHEGFFANPSHLVRCVKEAPLLRHRVETAVDEAVRWPVCVVGTDGSMLDVCELVRARGGVVQPEGSSMRDVAGIV
jgi:hypothetical protein